MPDISKFPRGVPGRDLKSNIAPYAVWADPKFIAQHPFWQYQPGKIFLGRSADKLIGVSDDRHMGTFAGNRAGKGVSAIIPNLLEYPGPILALDPKGELARITASRRGHGSKFVAQGLGQEVRVFDPFGVSGHPCASFNCIAMIDPASELAVDNAALIAEGLIIQEHGPGAHFTSAARNFSGAWSYTWRPKNGKIYARCSICAIWSRSMTSALIPCCMTCKPTSAASA
jgi:type IV secretion system protein VirD4